MSDDGIVLESILAIEGLVKGEDDRSLEIGALAYKMCVSGQVESPEEAVRLATEQVDNHNYS